MAELTTQEWFKIGKDFYLSDGAIYLYSQAFLKEIRAVMEGKESSLSAERTFIGLPTGGEWGRYIAVDFGGSMLRAARVFLTGKGYYVIERKAEMPLAVPGESDLTTAETTAEELFDALADLVGQVAARDKHYVLGHTFSFAVEQESLADGKLISWVKEIHTSGVEGHAVNELLKEALVRKGLSNIRPVALINDTTATLLTSAYARDACRVGLICGTGFNMCFYDAGRKEIVNLEAGDFSRLTRTVWDHAVDEKTQHPGRHVLEKMVAGAYLSRIYGEVVKAYFKTDSLPYITTGQMSRLFLIPSVKDMRMHMAVLWSRIMTLEDAKALSNLGASVFVRAAQLMGGAVAAVIRYLHGERPTEEQIVAIDGSVCTGVQGCIPVMTEAIDVCLRDVDDSQDGVLQTVVTPDCTTDGSLVGAAVAAAMALENEA